MKAIHSTYYDYKHLNGEAWLLGAYNGTPTTHEEPNLWAKKLHTARRVKKQLSSGEHAEKKTSTLFMVWFHSFELMISAFQAPINVDLLSNWHKEIKFLASCCQCWRGLWRHKQLKVRRLTAMCPLCTFPLHHWSRTGRDFQPSYEAGLLLLHTMLSPEIYTLL